jgi:hypothetical protein
MTPGIAPEGDDAGVADAVDSWSTGPTGAGSHRKATAMSYTPTADPFAVDRAGLRRAVLPVGVGSFVVAAFWIVMGAHDTTEIISMVALAAVTAAGVFGLVLPRALQQDGAPGRALTMSVLAVLLIVPAFWTGLPMVLGAAGALLGYAGRGASTGSRRCVAAAVIGALAVIGYLATYVSDQFFIGG